MAMLDLQAFKQKTFEVRLMDGTEIKLLKPSQRMVIDIMAYEEEMKNIKNPKGVIDSFISLIADILNNNTEGRKFTKSYVDKNFSYEVAMVFIQAYMEFVQEVNSDPNC